MTDSLIKLTGKLIENGMRFRRLRATGNFCKPQAASLEVTQRCIAKCVMCNIWRTPRNVRTLTMEDWLALLSNDLFTDLVELDVTGGEPFLRKDLGDLLTEFCGMKKKHLKLLRSIAVTTNGFMTRRILDETRKILIAANRARVDLVMVCAMDAVGGVHDRIRNYPGGWKRVDQTIQGLKRLRLEFPNLFIGLKTTVLPLNVGELDAIVRYAEKNELFAIISPCIITKGRYLNADLKSELAFTREQIQEMTRFFQRGTTRWSFHENRLVEYFQTGRMRKPCSCGFNYFFIRGQGALYLCPMIGSDLGDVTKTPIEKLLSSREAVQMRRRIGRFPECKHCTEPGLERYSLPFEGWTYLSLLLRMRKRRFLKMHRHMGLDKYFTMNAKKRRFFSIKKIRKGNPNAKVHH